MSRNRQDSEQPAPSTPWRPEGWRPSGTFDSTGFSPESGYSRQYGDGKRRPAGDRGRRVPGLLIAAVVAVLGLGAACLYGLVHYLRR